MSQSAEANIHVVKLIVVHLQEINAANARALDVNELVYLVSEALEEQPTYFSLDVEWFGINIEKSEMFPSLKTKNHLKKRKFTNTTLFDKQDIVDK